MGEQEIPSIYRRHRDNPGELALMEHLACCTCSQYVHIFVLQHYIICFSKLKTVCFLEEIMSAHKYPSGKHISALNED